MSTGAGPFTLYQSVGGSRRRTTGSSRPSGPSRSQIAAAEKSRQAEMIVGALRAIDAVAEQEFPVPAKPVAAVEATPDATALLTGEKRKAMHGIGLFQRSERKAAKARARAAAEVQARQLAQHAQAERDERQRDIDAFWRLLVVNNQDAVLTMLEHVFADNQAPASAVGVQRDEVQLAVLVPAPEAVIPERVPATTAAGNLSLRKMSRADFAAWDRTLVAGHILATVKEAFASAEQIEAAAVVALRDLGPDVYGERRVVPMLAVRLTRVGLTGVLWSKARSWEVLTQAGTDLTVNLRGAVRALAPLNLSGEPDLAALVAAVDIEDLTEASAQA